MSWDKYPCTGCGACCRRVEGAVKAYELLEPGYQFPYQWDASGKCEKLGEDNKCTVYDDRPLMCNIDRFIEKYNLPRDESYQQNISFCDKLIDEQGLSEKYKIK